MIRRLLFRLLFLPALLSIFALAAPAQSGGSGPPVRGNGPIRAHGDTDFQVYFHDLLEPQGFEKFGFVYSGQLDAPWGLLEETGVMEGLSRVNIRLDLGDHVGNKGEAIAVAKTHGRKVLVSFIGTPYSNASQFDGPQYDGNSMEPWARSVPADMQLYADTTAAWLRELEATHGVLPDYVELWSEVDRKDWWSGTQAEFFELYRTVAETLASEFGARGLKLGAAGFSSQTTYMEDPDEELALIRLGEFAAANSVPLDFVSWHHYVMGSGHLYFNTTAKLRARYAQLGLPGVELICSEWNLFPGGQNSPRGIELDGPHAAANFAVFRATAMHPLVELDKSFFFMLYDRGAQYGLVDLDGKGHGMLTQHGIRKPVYHVMDTFNSMKSRPGIRVDHPYREYAAAVAGARFNDRIVVVVANDVMERVRFFAMACWERGILPGLVGDVLEQVGYRRDDYPSVDELMAAGLSRYEAERALEILPLIFEVDDLQNAPREIRLKVMDETQVAVTQAWRFDSTHNNPSARRDELLPLLAQADTLARDLAWNATHTAFLDKGLTPLPRQVFEDLKSAAELATLLAVPYATAQDLWQTYYGTRDEGRLAMSDVLNDQPATRLTAETAAEARISVENGTIRLVVEPNAVTIFEIALPPTPGS